MVAVLLFLATRIGGLLFQECFIALGNGFQIAAILGRSGLTQRIREGLIASHVGGDRSRSTGASWPPRSSGSAGRAPKI